jgi:transcriptional regulator with XRE-family HTH domain
MLDKRIVATTAAWYYGAAMNEKSFRDRVRAAMAEQGVSKAELSRRSGVAYHAIDKWLKRDTGSTSTNNAVAIAGVLGITVDDERAYEELRELFYQLGEAERKFLIASARGLLS